MILSPPNNHFEHESGPGLGTADETIQSTLGGESHRWPVTGTPVRVRGLGALEVTCGADRESLRPSLQMHEVRRWSSAIALFGRHRNILCLVIFGPHRLRRSTDSTRQGRRSCGSHPRPLWSGRTERNEDPGLAESHDAGFGFLMYLSVYQAPRGTRSLKLPFSSGGDILGGM